MSLAYGAGEKDATALGKIILAVVAISMLIGVIIGMYVSSPERTVTVEQNKQDNVNQYHYAMTLDGNNFKFISTDDASEYNIQTTVEAIGYMLTEDILLNGEQLLEEEPYLSSFIIHYTDPATRKKMSRSFTRQ